MSSCCCCSCLLAIPVVFIVCCLLFRFIYRRTSGRCTSTKKMNGKTVIITGANSGNGLLSGIGFWTARDLALRGARLILACRNKEKAEKVRESLISETKNKNILVKIVDVSDLNSVRRFCKDILATEKRLDVLINNAGIGLPDRRESAQGYELTLASNHYGHFLMTNLLLELLKKSAPSRIVNVSSSVHSSYYLDVNDLHFKTRTYGTYKAYAQSKLCNILFTKELSHRLLGTGVTVNSLHPGCVVTEIMDKEGTLLGKFLTALGYLTFKDAELGAQTTIYLAVADEVAKVSGEYFVDCKLADCSKKARDPGLAKKLWEITEDEVGLKNKAKI